VPQTDRSAGESRGLAFPFREEIRLGYASAKSYSSPSKMRRKLPGPSLGHKTDCDTPSVPMQSPSRGSSGPPCKPTTPYRCCGSITGRWWIGRRWRSTGPFGPKIYSSRSGTCCPCQRIWLSSWPRGNPPHTDTWMPLSNERRKRRLLMHATLSVWRKANRLPPRRADRMRSSGNLGMVDQTAASVWRLLSSNRSDR
jgi:hypothetical protein